MKRILICLDGTWNAETNPASPQATNVIRLHDSAQHFKSPFQQSCYVPGVGTKIFEKLRGGIFGQGIFEQIKDGYLEIVNNYQPGARIIIAGFSRGAFSARCLASFVATCGILRNHASDFADLRDKIAIDRLWDLYADRTKQGPALHSFISRNCEPPTQGMVEAVAVWDTVSSLGVPWGILPQNATVEMLQQASDHDYSFLDSQLPDTVPRAYHAVALDEQREPFRPTLFKGDRLNDGSILQVWFAGAHSNVGGGFADTRLSDIALDWMIRQLSLNHGLNLKPRAVSPDAPWAPIGQTTMDDVAEKAKKIDHGKLQLLTPRNVPVEALLHPTADLRVKGQPGRPGIPSKAKFSGPWKVWQS